MLEGFDLPPIKAKVDTGARSSALHATKVKTFQRDGVIWVSFVVHPKQRSVTDSRTLVVPVHEFRKIRSSSGHETERPVILTPVVIGASRWMLELTLANRDAMGFRMLLGRQALKKRFRIDPGCSYLQGPPQSVKHSDP